MGLKVLLVIKDRQEVRGLKEYKALKETKVLQGQVAQQELRVHPEHPDQLVSPAFKVLSAQVGPAEPQELQVQPA